MWDINVLISNIFFAVILADHNKKFIKIDDDSDCDFTKLVQSPLFVDKTLMVKMVIKDIPGLYFSAPPGFGKSCNLDMLRRFFELQIDENGEPLTKVNYFQDLVEDTSNYRLFVDNKLAITKHWDLMREHFGKFPVIFMNFKCNETLKTYLEAKEYLKEVTYRAIMQHSYLLNSSRLNELQKRRLLQWVNDKDGESTSIFKASILSEALIDHFRTKPVILIDNFNSIFSSIVIHSKVDQLVEYGKLFTKFFERFLPNRKLSAVMGVYYVFTQEWNWTCRGVKAYTFGNHLPVNNFNSYIDYFGFTEREFLNLMKSNKINENQIPQIMSWYGYDYCETTKLYRMSSVISFLERRKLGNYWGQNDLSRNLKYAFNNSIIRCKVDRLLSGEEISIAYGPGIPVEYFSVFEMLYINLEKFSLFHGDVFLCILYAHGYLTARNLFPFTSYTEFDRLVSIPNEEIKAELNLYRIDLFENHWKLDYKLIDDCADTLKDISFNKDEENRYRLIKFNEAIHKLFKSLKSPPIARLDEGVYQSVLLHVTQRTKFAGKPKIHYSNYRFLSIIVYLVERCIAFSLRFSERELILSKPGAQTEYLEDTNCYNLFNDSALFPDGVNEFLHLELFISERKNTYLRAFFNGSETENEMDLESTTTCE